MPISRRAKPRYFSVGLQIVLRTPKENYVNRYQSHMTTSTNRAIPFSRVLVFSVIAGLLVFLQNNGSFVWLSSSVCYFLMALAWVLVFFCIPRSKSVVSGPVDPHPGRRSLTLWLTQGSLWVGLGTLGWLLLLQPAQSTRAMGISLDSYDPKESPGVIIALLVGLTLLGTSVIAWRDLRKSEAATRRYQRGALALLIFTGILWSFILLALCVPSVFLDVVSG